MELRYDTMTVMQQVKDAAGIHFSSFDDPDKQKVPREDQEAIERGAHASDPTWMPDKKWEEKHLAPAKPFEERGIKVLE